MKIFLCYCVYPYINISHRKSIFILFEITIFTSGIFLCNIFYKAIGGILCGNTFFIMARKTNKNVILRHLLIIVAFGFMLLFVSEQAVALISFFFPHLI
jgi:hypothetical protein